VLSVPNVTPSPLWLTAWEGFELAQLSLGRSPKSIRNRQSSVMLLARWATSEGLTDPEKVTKIDLRSYLALQLKHRKGSGAATLYQDLKVFWDWFAADYEIKSPMTGVPRPKVKSRTVPVLRPEQLKKILNACKHKDPWFTARDAAMVWLLLESGLRRAELAAANVEDVDLKSRTIAVPLGKGGKSRVAVFGDDTANALWRWLRRLGRREGPLFVSRFGNRVTLSGIGDILHRIGDETAGVPLRPHMLRHAFAHYSLDAGAAEGDLMEVAGWQTRAMLDRYGAELKRERALGHMRNIQVGKAIKGER